MASDMGPIWISHGSSGLFCSLSLSNSGEYGLGDSGGLYLGAWVMLEDQVLSWDFPSGPWVTVCLG